MNNFNEYIIIFITILLFTLGLIYFINRKAYDNNGKLICDNYVLSTYLYILLSFVLMGLFALIYIYTNFYGSMLKFFKSSGIGMLIFIFIMYIVLLIGCFILLNKLDPVKQGELLHLVWLILLLLLSILFGITVMFGMMNNTLLTALLLLVLITAITGFVGYKYGKQLLPIDFDKYLYGALIVLVVVQFGVVFLVKDKAIMEKLIYVFAFISLIIFVLLMLSYNNKIRQRAEQCNAEFNPPNYPKEAMGLVIKMLNVLQDLLVLLGRKKGGRR
jgi:hypothetical protein